MGLTSISRLSATTNQPRGKVLGPKPYSVAFATSNLLSIRAEPVRWNDGSAVQFLARLS